jgi:N-acetylglucosamine kinase
MSAPSNHLFLGIDGGGTKTASVILDENRTELGRGLAGPCNIATTSDELLRVSVSQALRSALEAAGLPAETRFEAVCAGVAGYTAKKRRAEFARLLEELIPAERHQVEPDFKIAYWGATEGEPGIIVSAGTGAVVYGRNDKGEVCRFDGRGFLLGDRGSAYDVAQWYLKQLARRLEKGRELRAMDREIMSEIGIEDLDGLIEWVYRPFEPARIASVTYIISRCADAGDEHAVLRIESAGQTLRTAAERVRRQLELPADSPLFLMGSMWSAGEPIMRGFNRGFDQLPPPPTPHLGKPRSDAAYGAALLAMQAG